MFYGPAEGFYLVGGRFPKVTAAKAVICRFSQEQFFGVCQPERKRDGTPSVGLYVHIQE